MRDHISPPSSSSYSSSSSRLQFQCRKGVLQSLQVPAMDIFMLQQVLGHAVGGTPSSHGVW